MIGQTLAHYQFTAHLGSGGMGEVFQATDSRLGRSVAIKFLPDAFARDAERVARFQREARVLASLNHPQIAAIYGLEESEGRHFLVMELVPGETLAERIRRGPIPIEEALGITRQIADALDSAHEKGVIHRDLKPANIKITPDGNVKVLDFGLAKVYDAEPISGISASNSPTISQAATLQGVILGTAAYMSPEQARGKAVDRRADIWAFGVVLYEMVTGRRLFEGETVSDTLAAVLERDLRLEAVPVRVRSLIRSCLERDPRKRLRDIGDAWRLLDSSLNVSGMEAAPATSLRSRLLVLLAAGLGVALLAMSIPAALFFLRAPEVAEEIRFEMQAPGSSAPAISPDGQRIAYTATSNGKSMIWIRPIGAIEARVLPGTENAAEGVFWAPDNRSLAFFADSKLKKVDVVSGGVQALTDASIPAPGAWNDSGDILFSGVTAQGFAIRRISSSGGPVTSVTPGSDLSSKTITIYPLFLPDQRHFVYHTAPIGGGGGATAWIGSLDSADSKPIRLTEIPNMQFGSSPIRYADPGYLLFTRDRVLLAQAFNAKTLKMAGDPVPVAENVAPSFSVSKNGRLVYRSAVQSGSAQSVAGQLLWFDRRGKPAGEVPAPSRAQSLQLSRDGEHIAIDSSGSTDGATWVVDRGGRAQKLTTDRASYPIWNPSGNVIAFSGSRPGVPDIFQKASNGAGTEEKLVSSPDVELPLDWSSDGRYIVFERYKLEELGQMDLWVLPIFGDRKPFAFLESPARESQAQISPSGRYIAYVTNESGANQIVVRTFPDSTKGQWPITRDGGTEPRWRRADGGELYYLAPDGKVMMVPVTASGDKFSAGAATLLFPAPALVPQPTPVLRRYDVTADGQKFLFAASADAPSEPAASTPIIAVINWQNALSKKR